MMYRDVAMDNQGLVEAQAEEGLSDAGGMPGAASAERQQPGWQRRVLFPGLVLAGVIGCAFGASQLLAKSSLQTQTIHSELAIMEKEVIVTENVSGDTANATGDAANATEDAESVTVSVSGEEPAFITWKGHPTKCWALPEKMENSAKLQMDDCTDETDYFFIPSGGTGEIRPVAHPEFCVDAPGGESSVVQFFKCEGIEKKTNKVWLLPYQRTGEIKQRMGEIKTTHNETRCVDVPGGNLMNGAVVQQWNCTKKAAKNEGFVINWPSGCTWDAWSNWTDCESECKDFYSTRERRSTKDGGDDCRAHKTEKKQCGVDACDGHPKSGAKGMRQLPGALIAGLSLLASLELFVHW